jgi:hypothetical protein
MGVTVLNINAFYPTYDPYDLWATPTGVAVRKNFYSGKLRGKLAAGLLVGADLFFPYLARNLFDCRPRYYPIVIAHEILEKSLQNKINYSYALEALSVLKKTATYYGTQGGRAWGLGFPWMSKNGFYSPSTPFITHTPYVMQALLALAKINRVKKEALSMFYDTWFFIEKLLKMHEDTECLALSYAPVLEHRIVINANAYASFAYGLHATYGAVAVKKIAKEKALKISRWVVQQQNKDGSWNYYADDQPGNFIDCFHSCFVIKNLFRLYKLVPEAENFIAPSLRSGWIFLQNNFYDTYACVCHRFSKRDFRDPYKFDLYDQAEYLGLLIDFGLLENAEYFTQQITRRFRKENKWYCKTDNFGRKWGRNFNRWGVMPFKYQMSRLLSCSLSSEGQDTAET